MRQIEMDCEHNPRTHKPAFTHETTRCPNAATIVLGVATGPRLCLSCVNLPRFEDQQRYRRRINVDGS